MKVSPPHVKTEKGIVIIAFFVACMNIITLHQNLMLCLTLLGDGFTALSKSAMLLYNVFFRFQICLSV